MPARIVLLLLLARLPVWAGNLKAPEAAYPPVPLGWAGALPGPLPAPLSGLDLKDAAQRQVFAPVAHALGADLGLTPERFRDLPSSERAAALGLAVEQAREGLRARVERLATQAHGEAWTAEPGDRARRLRVYGIAAGLDEIRGRYARYLDGDGLRLLEKGWARASARAYRMAEVLGGAADPGAVPAVEESAPPPASARATGAALKTLESMRVSRAGWTLDDLRGLFLGFGFEERVGAKHVIFVHPRFPELRKSVSRSSGALAKGYSTAAIRLLDTLAELEANAARASAPIPRTAPRKLELSDFSVLLSPP